MIYDIILGAGELALLAGLCWLAWLLRRECAARAAAVAALDARQAVAEEKALKLALLDRRLAVIAPLEDLCLALDRGCRVEANALAAAARALGEARLLFPGALAAEMAEVAALLHGYERNQAWLREAVGAGRHEERKGLADAEMAIEQVLKPKLTGLGSMFAQVARLEN
jgi:hypothetical protein